MFSYACREDTYALPGNPVKATSKRREMPAAVLDFYEPDETEALARAAACGAHRGSPVYGIDADELEWRAWEDRQDAELYRVAAYTGMRLGELLALRWEDVDLDGRRVIVHRAVSANVEGPTKSWQARALPLADQRPRHSPGWPTVATTPPGTTTCSARGSAAAWTPPPSGDATRTRGTPPACDRCAFTLCATPPARSWLARRARISCRHSSGTPG